MIKELKHIYIELKSGRKLMVELEKICGMKRKKYITNNAIIEKFFIKIIELNSKGIAFVTEKLEENKEYEISEVVFNTLLEEIKSLKELEEDINNTYYLEKSNFYREYPKDKINFKIKKIMYFTEKGLCYKYYLFQIFPEEKEIIEITDNIANELEQKESIIKVD
ncbi:MAG: hypothetical protein MJH09_04905 [Cetobacterium sp.]|nr:hypothetical protein [Cetobacterium sp.]